MNTRKKGVNTTVLFIVIITVIVSYFCIKSHPRPIGPKMHQMRRVRLLYHTDYEELLKAGREILRQGPKDTMNYKYYGIIYLGGFPVPDEIPIPKIIRDLKTYDTRINFTGYLFLEMEGGVSGYGVRIYPEDFKATRSPYFSYGNKELLPGLWYYDDEYHRIPQYDKTIDYIIQNGKYPEPNEIDSNENTK